MQMVLAILEDNHDRRRVMRSVLSDRFQRYDAKYFESASEMINFLDGNLERVLAVALDHDLELIPDGNGGCHDPGTGRDVANYLSARSAMFPVVVHSSNEPAALGMEMELKDAGWKTYRVTPYGDTAWIKKIWLPAMRRAIVDSVSPVGTKVS